ncbi:MAG: hypothetical protein KDK63_03995 [Chlamydiia bacterium]|nr:hypothetical protein [Chlamydiia bacterium]MCB1116293.1 hypothetical protein [Chlamydiia bacterium]
MASGLDARFQAVLSRDPLEEGVDSFFQNKGVDETLLLLSARTLFEKKEEFYPKLCALLFLRKFTKTASKELDELLASLLILGKKEYLGETSLLQKGYEALAAYLFCGERKTWEFKQLEKGAVLREGIPHLDENASIALVALYLGNEWGDEELFSKGQKCAAFVSGLSQGMWTKAEGLQGAFTPYMRLMDHALSNINRTDPLTTMDRSLGLLRYSYGEMSFSATASGNQTGLAALQKKEISIVSMGPHYAPLGVEGNYGVRRLSNGSQEGFKDLTIQSEEGRGKIEGWTRTSCQSAEESIESYLYFQFLAEKEGLSLTVRKSHDTKEELFFVFFVSAELATLEEDGALFPKTLKRFEGKAQKVVFEKNASRLEIAQKFEGEMQIIPLAGGNHFYSADFLIAYPLKKKLAPFSWTIK